MEDKSPPFLIELWRDRHLWAAFLYSLTGMLLLVFRVGVGIGALLFALGVASALTHEKNKTGERN